MRKKSLLFAPINVSRLGNNRNRNLLEKQLPESYDHILDVADARNKSRPATSATTSYLQTRARHNDPLAFMRKAVPKAISGRSNRRRPCSRAPVEEFSSRPPTLMKQSKSAPSKPWQVTDMIPPQSGRQMLPSLLRQGQDVIKPDVNVGFGRSVRTRPQTNPESGPRNTLFVPFSFCTPDNSLEKQLQRDAARKLLDQKRVKQALKKTDRNPASLTRAQASLVTWQTQKILMRSKMAALHGAELAGSALSMNEISKEAIHSDRNTHVKVLHGQTDKILGKRAAEERRKKKERNAVLNEWKRRKRWIILVLVAKAAGTFVCISAETRWGKVRKLTVQLRATISVRIKLKRAVKRSAAGMIREFFRQKSFSKKVEEEKDPFALTMQKLKPKFKAKKCIMLVHKNRNAEACFNMRYLMKRFHAQVLRAQVFINGYVACQKARIKALVLLRRRVRKVAGIRKAAEEKDKDKTERAKQQKTKQSKKGGSDDSQARLKNKKQAEYLANEKKLRQTHKQTTLLLGLYTPSIEKEEDQTQNNKLTKQCQAFLWQLRRDHVELCTDIAISARKFTVAHAKKEILGAEVASDEIKSKMPLFFPLQTAREAWEEELDLAI